MTERIPTTTAKQWKQHLQFELQGKDYNSLIFSSYEEISMLPFYTSENTVLHYHVHANPKVMLPLYCSNITETLKRITFWLSKGVQHFFITLHSELVQFNDLYEQLPSNGFYTFQLADDIKDDLPNLSNGTFVSDDFIHNFLKEGKWKTNQKDDFQLFKKITLKTENPSVFVDTTLYQNAGAGIIQQVAYGMAHCVAYLKEIEPFLDSKSVKIYFKVAVGSHFLFEISKLRAFRQVAESIFAVFQFPIEFFFMTEPSQRGLSILKTHHNQNYVSLAYESAVLGGSDFIVPKNEVIYKKNTTENQLIHIQKIHKILEFRKASFLNGMHCFETLSYEIAKKALLLFQNTEKSGGLLEQVFKRIVQKKIKEKALQEQLAFDNQLNDFHFATELFADKREWELYPFVKQKHEKTFVEPLIAKRLWENIEKKK